MNLENKKSPGKITPFLWLFIKKHIFSFLCIAATGVFWSINENLFSYSIKKIIDTLSSSESLEGGVWFSLKTTLLVMFVSFLIFEFSMRLRMRVSLYVFPLLRKDIRQAIFDYVSKQSYSYFSDNFVGSITNKMNDLPFASYRLLEAILFSIIPMSCYTFISGYLLWNVNPVFCVAMLIWTSIHIGISSVFFKSCNNTSTVHSNSVSVLSGKIVDCFSNIVNVHLFSSNNYEKLYIEKYQKDEIEKSKKASWKVEYMNTFQGISSLLFIFSMIPGVIYAWDHKWITIGDLALIIMLMIAILRNIWYLSHVINSLYREIGMIRSALELVSHPYEVSDKDDAGELICSKGDVSFTNVDFSYREGVDVFKNQSVFIPNKQRVGLVGLSGSGKSTFVNLILRFYNVNSGSIEIDGQNISDVTQNSLRNSIAMIPQDTSLFHRSLMENIRYGNLNASDDEVVRVSKLAHCHEFIDELDEKYDTLVGERGIKLSGGQRQRIAIARAILKNSPILILDEATSALDSLTEKYIQEGLDEAMRDKTVIVIAHRLSTLKNMDRILVFENGKIVEDGAPGELLQKNDGKFSHLWKMQSDGMIPKSDSVIK